jgi:hypothetical protein
MKPTQNVICKISAKGKENKVLRILFHMNVKPRFSLEVQLNSFVDNNSKKVFKAEKVSAALQESLGEVVS